MANIDDAVDLQIQKMDEALAKRNKDIVAIIKVLEEKADGVNKKFAAHGELINQELDKLMVRSANLEDAVAMQVSNLSGVSDKAIASMQEVENALSANASSLGEKVLAANPAEVEAYKGGKTKLISFFVGQVMREMRGKANPALVNEALSRFLGQA